jgi:hypothetical protein
VVIFVVIGVAFTGRKSESSVFNKEAHMARRYIPPDVPEFQPSDVPTTPKEIIGRMAKIDLEFARLVFVSFHERLSQWEPGYSSVEIRKLSDNTRPYLLGISVDLRSWLEQLHQGQRGDHIEVGCICDGDFNQSLWVSPSLIKIRRQRKGTKHTTTVLEIPLRDGELEKLIQTLSEI